MKKVSALISGLSIALFALTASAAPAANEAAREATSASAEQQRADANKPQQQQPKAEQQRADANKQQPEEAAAAKDSKKAR